ncbi:hypothetical protein WJX74_002496 [Apatococcus lobatus]|uniref:Calponin-homology (CH) domain-containing protein n=1 Tax=Apatococcus lobatus TaxID=904363 RepID=A0AAW1SFP0_9CHLO
MLHLKKAPRAASFVSEKEPRPAGPLKERQNVQEQALIAWVNSKYPEQPDLQAHPQLQGLLRSRLQRTRALGAQYLTLMATIEERLRKGRLSLQDEKQQLGSLTFQKSILDALCCYHPLWLQVALGVISGDKAATQSGMWSKQALADSIRSVMLQLPKNAPARPARPMPVQQMSRGQLLIKRVIMLVVLLDQTAMAADLPSQAPLLFATSCAIKSSAEMACALLRKHLQGEHDIVRALAKLGCSLSYQQAPSDEIKFSISMLAVDLRDGVRLNRLIEHLTGLGRQQEGLHYPCQNKRGLQLQNLSVVFDKLRALHVCLKGIEDDRLIAPENVADGERQASLDVLWRIFLDLQLPRLISRRQLELEIVRLTRAVAVGEDECRFSVPQNHPHLHLLLTWAATICRQHQCTVDNFSASFASGRALCILVHHYLPWLMPISSIQEASVQQPKMLDENTPPNAGSQNSHSVNLAPTAAEANFAQVAAAVASLGGMPAIASAQALAHSNPDALTMAAYTAYVGARLLESAAEERAAFCIQTHWRRRTSWSPGMMRARRHRWVTAAACIQRVVRLWMLRSHLTASRQTRRRMLLAISRLQACWKRRKQQQYYLQLQAAAILLQAQHRGRLVRREYRRLKAAIQLQTLWRGRAARLELRRHKGARVVQKCWRGHQSRQLLKQSRASTVISRHVRGWQARALAWQMRAHGYAATRIQATWRMHRVLRHTAAVRAASCIQKHWAMLQFRRALHRHQAARSIQTRWRGLAARQHAAQCRAARSIQSCWRGWLVRRSLLLDRCATLIQRCWLSRQQRLAYLKLKHHCIQVQAHARAHIYRARYRRQLRLITIFQACWRGFRTRNIIRDIKARASSKRAATLKRAIRRFAKAAHKYSQSMVAVVRIQAAWRGHSARKAYLAWLARLEAERIEREREVAAALKTLTHWLPVFRARVKFLQVRRAICFLQSLWRIKFQQRRAASICIQRMARGWMARQRFCSHYLGMVYIQAVWRGHLVRQSSGAAVHEARRQIEAAYARAPQCQERQLITLTFSCLHVIQSAKCLDAQEQEACTLLVFCMENSTYCCHHALEANLLQAAMRLLKSASKQKPTAASLDQLLALVELLMQTCLHDSVLPERLMSTVLEALQHFRKHEELFCLVLGTVMKFEQCCGSQLCQSMRKTLESLQSLLMRDEERESKHVQHLGGTRGPAAQKAGGRLESLRHQLQQLGMAIAGDTAVRHR